MDSTGEILRRARNERRLTLDEVSIRTRINRKYLAAIESGDRDAVPGGFFYKSFVRQYATALSTDDDNVLDEVEQSLAAEQPASPSGPDEEVLRSLVSNADENGASSPFASRSAAAYALLLILAIAGTSGLYMLWHRAQQAQAAGEATRRTRPQAQAPAPVVPQPPVAAPTAALPASTTPTNPPVSAEDKIALNVSANEETWFSLSADGKTVFSGILAEGENKAFRAKDNARMRIGNAGGLDIVFNGKATGPLGPLGQVVTVVFTPEKFQIMKPNPDAEPD